MRRERIVTPTLFALVAAIFTTSAYAESGATRQGDLELYQTFEAPDRGHRVEVWRSPTTVAMPGQSSDAPGVVRLLDARGRLLAQEPVEMVQLADRVDWTGDRVSVGLVVEWDLSALAALPHLSPARP